MGHSTTSSETLTLPASGPATAPALSGSASTDAAAAGIGLTSAYRPPRPWPQVLRRMAELVLLAILVVFTILALSARADAYPAANDTQWKPWAQKWHKIAVKERKVLVKHTDALGLPKPRKVPTIREWTVTVNDPSTGVSVDTMSWHHYGTDSKRVAKAFRARTKVLHHRLVRPGGGGAARWWPAALYSGWHPSLKSWFCYIVWRESSARPLAVNPSSGCFGLMQLHPIHWAKYGRTWIRDPLNQLWLAWRLYKKAGATPWAL